MPVIQNLLNDDNSSINSESINSIDLGTVRHYREKSAPVLDNEFFKYNPGYVEENLLNKLSRTPSNHMQSSKFRQMEQEDRSDTTLFNDDVLAKSECSKIETDSDDRQNTLVNKPINTFKMTLRDTKRRLLEFLGKRPVGSSAPNEARTDEHIMDIRNKTEYEKFENFNFGPLITRVNNSNSSLNESKNDSQISFTESHLATFNTDFDPYDANILSFNSTVNDNSEWANKSSRQGTTRSFKIFTIFKKKKETLTDRYFGDDLRSERLLSEDLKAIPFEFDLDCAPMRNKSLRRALSSIFRFAEKTSHDESES